MRIARIVASFAAEPIHANLVMSYFTPCTRVSCAIGRLRLKVPMVRPSGFATLYMWLAAMMLLPPGMFCTMTVGLPGR